MIEESVKAFEDDRITEAVLTLKQCNKETLLSLTTAQKKVCEKIRECEHEMVAFIQNTFDEERWKPSYEYRGVTVSLEDTPRQKGDRLLSVKCEGKVESDAFAICACLFECEKFIDWMPGVDESIILEEISRFRKVVRVSGPKPWPVKRDEVAVEAYGDVIDCSNLLGMKKAGVCVYLKTANEKKYPKTKGRHQVSVDGGWWIEQLSPEETNLCLVARIDPKLRFCPSWVINFVVKNIAYRFIPMVAKQAETFKPGAKNYNRILAQPQVYDEIKRRLSLIQNTREKREEMPLSPSVNHDDKVITDYEETKEEHSFPTTLNEVDLQQVRNDDNKQQDEERISSFSETHEQNISEQRLSDSQHYHSLSFIAFAAIISTMILVITTPMLI
mmetsp:Transcript_4628/g.6584  ORF Transcript_4628/g.6584 Transcript_4628/m.6584 type:complete len:387 (+) Transcript_4628:73-1233(+)